MTAHIYAAANIGFEGKLIEVECDSSNGLPGLVIVGLGNRAIDESKERVRSAIKNTNLDFPTKRITVNLAPANLQKHGAHFDLAIAVSLLVVSNQLPQEAVRNTLFIGELALDGSMRPVAGVISHAEAARTAGLKTLIVPAASAEQASLVEGITVFPAKNLKEVYLHLSGKQLLAHHQSQPATSPKPAKGPNLADIRGQERAKRALLIAAAGHHNILFTGPPGSGKTMLAQAMRTLLPPLSKTSIIEVTKLYSLAGETYEQVITERPFRSPHHSASHVALTGGGRPPKPGEISLAHHGVLFLDEIPEYSRAALEALRQPLEDRQINIARVNEHALFPADFMLIATQNPCPCGYAGDPNQECTCSASHVLQYQKRISGPLMDRIDIVVEVPRMNPRELIDQSPARQDDPSATLVVNARGIQAQRYGTTSLTNAHLTSKQVGTVANLGSGSKQLLDKAAATLQLSARAYFKVIKVARTIADIERSDKIMPSHIAEALQYRPYKGPR